MSATPTFRLFGFLALAPILLAALPGCFVIVEGDDDDAPFVNDLPYIYEDENSTYWSCGLDEMVSEYSFEFQTIVDDPDGLSDIDEVIAFVDDADSGVELDSFDLMNEGDGVYGGLVWEDESNLRCGDPIDVTFQVWDVHGDSASFTLLYY